MKKITFAILSLFFVLVFSSYSIAGDDCTTIKDGILTYSAGHYLEGEPLETGYDPYGYNYQARMFRGSYANVYLGGAGYPPYEDNDEAYLAANPGAESHWAWPYRKVTLIMKWSDSWLSRKDCDGDLKLDRHYGFDTYIGSGAWETNHQYGSYIQTIHINIGDSVSEEGYNVVGWSDVWTWGGTYGGGDDGTLRTVIPKSSDCQYDDKEAYFSINTEGTAQVLRLRHLMGSQDDSYEVYVKDGNTWTQLSILSSEDEVCSGLECWYTDTYELGLRTGILDFKIVATIDPIPTWCTSWGLNAFSWTEVETVCEWTYFVKIVAVPIDATIIDGFWYTADGKEIGPSIWGQFAIIQEVENDACAGIEGKQYVSPAGPGFGQYHEKPDESETP